MTNAQIETVNVTELNRPLSSPFEISLGVQREITNAKVVVETSDGVTGVGEAAPVPSVTGETQGTVIKACEYGGSLIEGMQLADVRGISDTLKQSLRTQSAARAGIEIAVYDALCRTYGCSLADFVGGRDADVRTDDTIGITSVEEAEHDASDAIEAGFNELKIKIGGDVDEDIRRVTAIHEVAPDAELKIDANQGYSPKEAIQFVEAIQSKGIEIALFEQPVPYHDISGLQTVTDAVSVSIAADESVFTREDAARVIKHDAADIINIKLMKAGIRDALDIIGMAQANGLQLMIGCMLESSIGINAGAHLVSGTGAFSYVDLDGNFVIEDTVEPVEYGPSININGPGIGVDIGVD